MPIYQDDVRDVRLNYQTFGNQSKPALVFSNSLGTNYTMWQAQIDALQDEFYLICYDTRGHGASSTPKGEWQIADLADDVLGLLSHLNINEASFCGISMGGLLGQYLAIHHGDTFGRIIISNTAAKIGQSQAWLDRIALINNQGLMPIAKTAAGRWFTDEFIQGNPSVIDKLSQELASGSRDGYAKCCAILANTDLRTDIAKATVPMLVVAGECDPVTTVADGKYIVNTAPHAQLATIDASHIANIEQAEAFNGLLRQFLT